MFHGQSSLHVADGGVSGAGASMTRGRFEKKKGRAQRQHANVENGG